MPEAVSYIKLCNETKEEIQAIENEAKESAPRWAHAVSLFNDRFVDMPFTLSIPNQAQAVLGKEKARLLFTFKDGNDIVEWNRSEIKTLSQGEKRALYLLNFIFDVESRLNTGNDILFIIDDVADSFDYKNKHAIIQYLEDIDSTPHFYQIILTHNFDFFRALANNFTNRRRCLMANRNALGISLTRADGIKNYFTGIMKQKFQKSRSVLCATIPFTRNIIEYTKGESDPDYLTLTNLLHWKENTDQITVDDYVSIFNSTFGTSYSGEKKPLKELLYEEADNISNQASHDGLNLEDKVLLSMATRMKSEEFIIREIRRITNNNDYWCNSNNQFGFLIKKYTELVNESQALRSLEKVSITVSSNIHLNSFMYEPILDLTIDHLIYLYNEIKNLKHD